MRLPTGIGSIGLISLVLAPWVPPPWSLGVLVFGLALFYFSRPIKREFVGLLLAVLAVGGLITFEWMQELGFRAERDRWRQVAQDRYGEFWGDLQHRARSTAAEFSDPVESRAERLSVFRNLEDNGNWDQGSLTVLIVNPDGEPVAWRGRGLLYDPESWEIPRHGAAWWTGSDSATLIWVEAIDNTDRPWRVLVGGSWPVAEVPFKMPPGSWKWSPVWEETDDVLKVPEAPYLLLEESSKASLREERRPLRSWIWGLLAVALLSLTLHRSLFFETVVNDSRPWPWAVPVLGSAVSLSWALSTPWLGTIGLGLGAIVIAWSRSRGVGWRGTLPPILLGAVAAVALGLGALWGHRTYGVLDVSSSIGEWASLGPALGFGLWALALLFLAAGTGMDRELKGRYAWWTLAWALLGGMSLDFPWLAFSCLAVCGAGTAWWGYGLKRWEKSGRTIVFLFLGLCVAALSWEIGARMEQRRAISERILPAVASPSLEELQTISAEIQEFFSELDLVDLTPAPVDERQTSDLAYALWKRSPLARPDALSALVVRPPEGDLLVFSFGLPVNVEEGELASEPARWQHLVEPVWGKAVVEGEATLVSSTVPWGEVTFWVMPLPGYRLERWDEVDLVTGLLQVQGGRASLGLPADVLYALYDQEGNALYSPWREAPPLSSTLKTAVQQKLVSTPEGPAWGVAAPERDRWQVIYLPVLLPLEGLERLGGHLLNLIFALSLLASLVFLLSLIRPMGREALRLAFRSYSRRLVILFTILLLAPLLALELFLVGTLEDELREEKLQFGKESLSSAQQVLGEYLLDLSPGFSLDTILDDDLLDWLSRVVHHELNLYWRSEFYASSEKELFTANLLPARIPGEIYSQLALRNYDLAERTTILGSTRYLELYAPLKVPGTAPSEGILFLSMPMLAQEQALEAEVLTLRRQALLVTAALFGLLLGIGSRLVRGFTEPLNDLVEGTKEIAQGSESLRKIPKVLELSILGTAIDEMARKVAEGRRHLLREKQVIERVVDNITSGVVSLDHDLGVMMVNQTARELLNVSVGDSLVESLYMAHETSPLLAFLETPLRAKPREDTVIFAPSGGEEQRWRVVWIPLPGAGNPASIFVVEDATEVLRAQRLEAWAEMARMIAHEIKNPLTPIQLSAEHMLEVYEDDPEHFAKVFEKCTRNILTQVEELQEISSEFSTYSHIPEMDRVEGDLKASLRELFGGYQTAPPPGVGMEIELPENEVRMHFDHRILPRAIRNLIENAIRACGGKGKVRLILEEDRETIRITVTDEGPGVKEAVIGRIFDPYFSTHDSGTGLGLPIARRIIEGHGGQIEATNRHSGGLAVRIRMPKE